MNIIKCVYAYSQQAMSNRKQNTTDKQPNSINSQYQ